MLVVGGSGFLGRTTVAWALEQGVAVDATYFTNAPQAAGLGSVGEIRGVLSLIHI